jgi:Flp pilus assembly protein CpaB
MAVTMRQAELLTLAKSEGLVSVALRHPSDVELIDGLPEASRADLLVESRRALLQQRHPTIAPKKPPAKNSPAEESVEIILGQ